MEIFHRDDVDEKDCLGWITVSSRAECDLATALQQNKLDIEERKCIILQLKNVLNYLTSLNLIYFDLKLQNILLLKKDSKYQMRLADFGIMCEASGKSSFREMGYIRSGSKFMITDGKGIKGGTPGFCVGQQLFEGLAGNQPLFKIMIFLLCEWQSAWKINFHSLAHQEQLIVDDCFAQAGLNDFRIHFEAKMEAWIEGRSVDQMSIWDLTQQAKSIVTINFISSDIEKVEDNTALIHNFENVDFSFDQYVLSRTMMVSRIATNQKDTYLCSIIAASVSFYWSFAIFKIHLDLVSIRSRNIFTKTIPEQSRCSKRNFTNRKERDVFYTI